jgi:hypothetical protein
MLVPSSAGLPPARNGPISDEFGEVLKEHPSESLGLTALNHKSSIRVKKFATGASFGKN